MVRIISLVGAVIGALSLSQFPAFSQQYQQRLGGAVDELARIVARFDQAAEAADLSREAALQELSGSPFLDAQQHAMAEDIARYERLQSSLDALQNSSPLQQLAMPYQFSDPALLAATWQDFQPGVQLTLPAIILVVIGFGAGGLGVRGVAWGVVRLWRASPASGTEHSPK